MPTRWIWRLPRGVIGLALVARLLDEWWSWLPAGVIDDLRRDLGLTYTNSGWLLAMMWIGGLLGTPIGSLADHLPRRPLAVAGAMTLSGGLLAYALAAPFAVLMVATTALGAASDAVLRPLESSLAEVAGDRLDVLLGRQHLISWLGDFAGPGILMIGSATPLGWRGAFGVTAAVMGVYALVMLRTEFPPPPRRAAPRRAIGEARDLARSPEILVLVAAELALGPLDEPLLGAVIARYAAEGGGAGSQLLALPVMIGGVVGSGFVSRFGLSRRTRLAGGPLLFAGAVVSAAGSRWVVAQILGLLAVAAGMALVWATTHHRMLTVRPDRSGTVVGIVGLLATPAAAVPIAVGALADRSSLTAGLWLYAGIAAIVVVVMTRIDRQLGGAPIAPADLESD